MSTASPSPDGFAAEIDAQAARTLRVASGLAIVAFVAMAYVDTLLVGGQALQNAWVVRLVVVAALAVVLGLSSRPAWATRWFFGASMVTLALTAGGVIVLTMITGGGQSDYHEALYITLFGYAMLPLPWSRRATVLAFFAVWLAFNVVLLAGGNPGPRGVFATHNVLLGAAVLIAVVLREIMMGDRERSFEARARLAAANQELHALDKAKSRFFANLSHELRTPLTLTLAPLEALLADDRAPLDEGHRQHLLLAQRNAMRLLRLVDDLLALTRAEAASLPLDLQELHPGSFLHVLAEDVGSLTARKQIDLSVELDGVVPSFPADAQLVERVFLNLLANSARFTPVGGRIILRAYARDEGVVLAVQDTGIGIASDELEHVFDRFYQVDSSSTRNTGGTGIGLSLVREIVEMHRGKIEVASAPGEGTTIRCWFPANLTPEAPTVPVSIGTRHGMPEWHERIRLDRSYRLQGVDDATERRVAPRPSQKRQAPSVLVVEDNPDMIRFVVALLAAEYNVLSAQNGADGLRLARERSPDLIISDVMMPGMDGLQMLEELQAEPQTRQIPVILMTARDGPDERIAGRHGGAVAFVAKPFRSEELRAAVQAVVSQRVSGEWTQLDRREEALMFLASGVAEQLEDSLDRIEEDESGPGAVASLRELARELKGFANAGSTPVEQPAHIDEVVALALETLAAEHPDRALLSSRRARGQVNMEHTELDGVVRALLSRALTVTPAHGSVSVETFELPDGKVELRVTDGGPGVLPRDAERLFYAYFDSHGLGLSHYRHLVQARGGSLTLDAAGSSGKTLVLCLSALPARPSSSISSTRSDQGLGAQR